MKKILIFLAVIYSSVQLPAQVINPEILRKPWDAFWIASNQNFQQEYGVYHFRKSISFNEKPTSFIVHVSADNRYKLYVNGTLVSLGPARGEIYNWNFETVDIAPYLVKGNNIVAAVVWNFGVLKGWAQTSYRTAFILQGDTEKEKVLNSNKTWKCIEDSSYAPYTKDSNNNIAYIGPCEQIDFNKFPAGWEKIGYEDSNWPAASELFNGLPKGAFAWTEGWMLVPRKIPAMELTDQRLKALRSYSGVTINKGFPETKQTFTIPSNTKATLLLDQGELTNAYFTVKFSGGKGAIIETGYAETLYDVNKNGNKPTYYKSDRNKVDGKTFIGLKDEITASGRVGEEFTSLFWRTYRYVNVTIHTTDEPLTIDDISGTFTGYPFVNNSTFQADNDTLQKIVATGWHTARMCAIETYMDCPYYEQLQYVGDTRIQAMVSLYNSGDDRLMKNAITQFDQSRMAEGITMSRFPCSSPQQIPTFSLWWIGMIHDFWMYRDDKDFVKSFIPGTRQVLNYFSKFQQKDGRVKDAPYWEFTDWVNTKGWSVGVAPVGKDGCSSVLDFQLLLAYQTASALEDSLGFTAIAMDYRKKAALLKKSITDSYWDVKKQLFADTKEHDLYSQHANALAILTDVVKGNEAEKLAIRMLRDSTATEATIYFKYYVNLALRKAGLGNLYLKQLQIWKDNLRYGLSTWAEVSDIPNTRSDCHAWGASPNIEFYRTVLGIDSDKPGFTSIKIEPNLGDLKNVEGEMPHPKGKIKAMYKLSDGFWQVNVELPKETSGYLKWKGKNRLLAAGNNSFKIK